MYHLDVLCLKSIKFPFSKKRKAATGQPGRGEREQGRGAEESRRREIGAQAGGGGK